MILLSLYQIPVKIVDLGTNEHIKSLILYTSRVQKFDNFVVGIQDRSSVGKYLDNHGNPGKPVIKV
jgi:hypothetical protein